MATPKLMYLSSLLRRSRSCSSAVYLYSQSCHHHHYLLQPSAPLSKLPSVPDNSTTASLVTPYGIIFPRHFSSGSMSHMDDDSELNRMDFISGIDASNIGNTISYEESNLPVRTLISLLDGYHDLTGLPWWVVIVSSTLVLRLTLFPFIVLQLHKLKSIGELFPKLPPPFPPPLSGRSFRHQIAHFRKERKAIGCPSFLWFGSTLAVQVPLFILGVVTFRTMSLHHHPGFDCGGILWFHNLTECPNGVLGPILPLLIAALHYVNVQVSFQNSSVGKVSRLFGTIAMCYQKYLEFLTIPFLFVGLNIPQKAYDHFLKLIEPRKLVGLNHSLFQASLIYWLTNSSITLVQQLALKDPVVLKKLRLPDKVAPVARIAGDQKAKSNLIEKYPSEMVGGISIQNLSAQELVALSVKLLADGKKDKAIPIVRLALDKDPEHVRALLILGQTLLQAGLLTEAIEYLERAISKLLNAGSPSDVEGVDLLILSSMWTGSACIRQGKNKEGMQHLERIASLTEPVDAKSKAHYYEGLLMLSSALYAAGRKVEAAEHLRRAAAYDDRYKEFLEQCEKDEDDFVDELVSSRRSDL